MVLRESCFRKDVTGVRVTDGTLKKRRARPRGAGVDCVRDSELQSFVPLETHILRAIFADAMRADNFSDASLYHVGDVFVWTSREFESRTAR